MVDAKTVGVLYTLVIGVVVAVVALLLFAVLRPRFPNVYQFRRLLHRYSAYDDFNGARVGFPSKRPEPGLVGWLGPTLAIDEDEVVRRIGLDAAMFLRFVRSQFFSFAIVSLFLCLVIWPVYGTASNKNLAEDDPNHVAGLQVVSLSNVEVGSSRVWATLLGEYVVAVVFLYFLYGDYSRYAEYRREYRTRENPANYAIVVYDIPDGQNNEEAVRARFDLMVPGQVSEVIMARRARPGMKAEQQLAKVIAKKEHAEFLQARTNVEPFTRPGALGALMFWKRKVPAIGYFTAEQQRLEEEIAECGRTAQNATSAIVVFSNKRAASLIAQANQGNNANEWTVSRAGEPQAVYWPAFHVPGYQAVWRAAAVGIFVFLLTLFWMIPATAIMGLANLESLSKVKAFEWAERIRDLSPAVVGLIENLLPAVILSVFLSLIPVFMRLAVSTTRLHGLHLIDSKTRNYFYIFTVFASFVFVVLAGSAVDKLQEMLESPSSIPSRLAAAIPRHGLFFTSFVIVKTFIPLALLLVNPARLVVRWILLKMSKTERERRKAEESGSIFLYFKEYGTCMMMTLIGLAYTTLAPIVSLFVTVFYAIAYAVYKHNILYACYRNWDGAGWDYPGAFYSVIVSLVLKQLTMIGVLGLYRGAAQSILAIIPLVGTVLFGMFCHHRYNRVALHGSLHDQYLSNAKIDEIPIRYMGLYEHPGVSVPEYRDLSGLRELDDIYPEEVEDDSDTETHVKSEHPDSAVGFVPDRTANRADV